MGVIGSSGLPPPFSSGPMRLALGLSAPTFRICLFFIPFRCVVA
jgi:hypothetical protein